MNSLKFIDIAIYIEQCNQIIKNSALIDIEKAKHEVTFWQCWRKEICAIAISISSAALYVALRKSL